MKTYEVLKWGKGFYIMTRSNGRAEGREWLKNKTAVNERVKTLKKEGYAQA